MENVRTFEYAGYLVEITEHPIYHDFQFVVKSLDGKKVIGTNTYFLGSDEAAAVAACELINDIPT
jgi:hypothetical protein